jgi:hypothetical protein
MGLFDGYQFSDTPQGSLIDRLLSQLQTQGQYQPSQGFAPNPMDASAAMPTQQNAPIGVGDYMMPRIGSGFQQNVQPQQGMTPEQYAATPVSNRVPQQGVAQPAPQASSLPEFLQPSGAGPGDRLLAGLQSFGGSGSLLGGISNAITGFSTGQRSDPVGQQKQALQAQYRALIPILGEQRAALAVLNPEIGKAMVSQALAGKQYAFTTAPDGTVIRTDAHAGTAEPVYQAGLKPTFDVIGEQDGQKTYGWIDPGKRTVSPYQSPGGATEDKGVMGPDGRLIPYPEGVDRPTFRKEISKIAADAAGGKKSEVQAKSEKFGNKMELAEKNLKSIEDEGSGFWNRVAEGSGYVPGSALAGRFLQTEKYQKYRQARDNFITALLRDESGAAIGTDEFNRYEKELFPQPGDSQGVIEQKREARRIAIEGMKKSAGPGYKSPTFDDAGGGAKSDPLGIR